jgi:hypothetical protein
MRSLRLDTLQTKGTSLLMQWGRCLGEGQPAMKSQEHGGPAMCPVCTQYLQVSIGNKVPRHQAVLSTEQHEDNTTHRFHLLARELPEDSQGGTFNP